jgi:hypothetical protein
MTIERGDPVVAELRGEDVVWNRLHLAAPEKRWHSGARTFADYVWLPLTWTSLCGLKGYLYRYDGAVRDAGVPFCAVCVKRCREDHGGVAVGWEPRALEVVA